MDPVSIAGLVVASAEFGATLLTEGRKRRRDAAADTLIAEIQRQVVGLHESAVNSITSATLMTGSITATSLHSALARPEMKAVSNELFVSLLAGTDDTRASAVAVAGATLSGLLKGSASDEDIEAFAQSFVQQLAEEQAGLISRVEEARPEALLEVRQLATLRRLNSVLENLQRSHDDRSKIRPTELLRAREEWRAGYKRQCVQKHGYIVPPDFDTDRKVPIEDLYVVPSLYPVEEAYKSRNLQYGRRIHAESVSVERFMQAIDRTVLLGDPGNGKSTISDYLTLQMAKQVDNPTPFFVTLREFAKQSGPEVSVLEYIERQLSVKYQMTLLPGFVEEELAAGRAIVFFDGLDELLDTTRRRAITEVVELFGYRYPLSPILVTSRRVGYGQARLSPTVFNAFGMSEFSDDEVSAYVNKWFACQQDYDEDESLEMATAFLEQSATVPDLRSNPLMLALMCIIFRGEKFIPRRRPDVYEKCAVLLFEKWDGHRSINVPIRAASFVDSAMKYVAHWMLISDAGEAGVESRDLVRVMTDYLQGRSIEDRDEAGRAAQEFVDFCRGRAWVFTDAGTTADGEALYKFTHRTFMEYFAAYHLNRSTEGPESLARTLLPRVASEQWDVVAQLAIQISDRSADQGSERALRTILRDRRKRSVANRTNILRFIARCFEFAVLSPQFVREFTRTTLEFAVAEVRDPREGWSTTRPMSDFRSFVPAEHEHVVNEETTNFFVDVLNSQDADRRMEGARLLLSMLSRASGEAVEIDSASDWRRWFIPLRDLTLDHFVSVSSLLEVSPQLHVAAIGAQLLRPHDGIAAMKRGNLTFGQIFWNESNSGSRHMGSMSLATLILIAASQAKDSIAPAAASVVEEISSCLVDEFNSNENRVGSNPNFGIFWNLSVETTHETLVYPGDRNWSGHADAALCLSIMGNAEIREQMVLRHHYASHSVDENLLRRTRLMESGSAQGIADFATRWVQGDIDVFTSWTPDSNAPSRSA